MRIGDAFLSLRVARSGGEWHVTLIVAYPPDAVVRSNDFELALLTSSGAELVPLHSSEDLGVEARGSLGHSQNLHFRFDSDAEPAQAVVHWLGASARFSLRGVES